MLAPKYQELRRLAEKSTPCPVCLSACIQHSSKEGTCWAEPVINWKNRFDLINDLETCIEALEFYAKGDHIEECNEEKELEAPDPEYPNWLCDDDDKFNLEDGSIARTALEKIASKAGQIEKRRRKSDRPR